MLDTITYGLTKDSPGGPILRSAEPMPHELYCGNHDDDHDIRPLSAGRLIDGAISLMLLIGTGGYLYLAL